MIKEIKMPPGGQTTDRSMIAQWMVKKGDTVKRGDVLLEIETDKATLPVESFAKGMVVDILVNQGEFASAGEVLALVGDQKDLDEYQGGSANADQAPAASHTVDGEDEYRPIMKGQAPQKPEAIAAVAASAAKVEMQGIKAMPNAKKYARENNIDLADFAQKNGLQVVKLAHLKNAPAGAGVASSVAASAYVDVPHTAMRRTIAKRMLQSTQSIPTYQVTVEVEMDECIRLRKKINEMQDAKVSYNDIIMKAISAAVKRFPDINASWMDDAVRRYRDVHVGLAVSVAGGLVVPVVQNVNKLGICEIAQVASEKIGKARDGRLSPDEMSGGTITLSNLGMYPVQHFTAIINPPEVCILALGSMDEKMLVKNGESRVATTMTITATFDHRVIDGAYGAQFLTELKQILELPALLSC